MKIELTHITVAELAAGYIDNQEEGVVAYAGRLDVRPPYQREFVYKEAQRDAVIDTVRHDYPLNVMYWAVREDGTFEIIDGQQRTISICQYVNGDFAFQNLYFHNLQDDEQQQILRYELTVYLCTGTDSERLRWFETINIAGEKLTKQELRNAVYAGPWVSDAKRYFSKTNCPAFGLASKYMNGSPIRQDYLQTAIEWLLHQDAASSVEAYMAQHQYDPNAGALWLYFQRVIGWIRATFTKYRKEMKGLDWGKLYALYGERVVDTQALEQEIARMMSDSEVEKKSGIYTYVFDHDEHHLQLRAFDDNTRREVYEQQQGICVRCGKHFELEQMHADHIVPWSKGGKTVKDNCQMLCSKCNERKGDK